MTKQTYTANYFMDQGRYRFEGDTYVEDTPFSEGQFVNLDFQEGLSLHCVECTDLINTSATIDIPAGFYIAVILDGDVNVAFEHEWINLHSQAVKRRSYVHGVIAHVPQPSQFHREWKKGKSERKISIYVSHDWLKQIMGDTLEDDAGLIQLLQQSFSQEWHPSKKSMLLAEHILYSVDQPDTVKRIQLLSHTLSIVDDALQSLAAQQGRRRVIARYYDNMHQIADLLSQGAFVDATVDEIALNMALSASTLQRQFKSVFGVSVDEYRRRLRLNKAKHMLESGNGNITQIASACGYNSVANFSTAFRKTFGVSPKKLREAKHHD